MESVKIAPNVDARHFTLETITNAYAAIEAGCLRGKLVVDIA